MRLEEEDWDTVLDTNLRSAYLASRAVLRPMMRQRWGRIVNISSVVGHTVTWGRATTPRQGRPLRPHPGPGPGSRHPRDHGQRRGPGFIDDGLTAHTGEDLRSWFLERVRWSLRDSGRGGRPVRLPLREDAGYITGQVLNIDGGLFMG